MLVVNIVVFQFSFTIINDQILITVECWYGCMLYILDHHNNVSIVFARHVWTTSIIHYDTKYTS